MASRHQSWAEWDSLVSDTSADPLDVLRAAVKWEAYFTAVADSAVDAAVAQGHPIHEIAVVLGVSADHVSARHRARI
jgi:hypothetical protein